jgi:hypothetical protein
MIKTPTMNEINLSTGPTYIRLLTKPGIPREEDYGAALELIHDGYAVGKYHVASSGAPRTQGGIDAFFSFAPTTKGRLFASELAESARQKTWCARLYRWLGHGLYALGGAALTAAATASSDAARKLLGLCT